MTVPLKLSYVIWKLRGMPTDTMETCSDCGTSEAPRLSISNNGKFLIECKCGHQCLGVTPNQAVNVWNTATGQYS